MILKNLQQTISFNFPKKIELIEENLEEMFKKRRSTLLILPAINKQVLDVVRTLDKCILAGGAALSLYTGDVNKIKDWDIFFLKAEGFKEARSALDELGFKRTKITDCAISLEKSGVVVQLITNGFHSSIEKLFSRFDFSICCFAVKGNNIYYTKQAVEDVKNNQFNYIHSENIITTIKRVARYGEKGFFPTTQCVKDMLNDCKKIPIEGKESS